VVLGRAARNRVNIKIRQPLGAITVGVRGESERASVLRLVDLIKDELNVKEVKFAEKIDEFADFKLKPAYRSLGKKYSKNVPKIVQALSNMSPESAKSELEVKGHLELVVDDSPIRLSEEDVQVQLEDKGGYAVEISRSHFVALSVELSADLIKEGFAREIVNKIQLMRKEANLKVSDRIALYLESTPKIHEAFEANRHYVMHETLSRHVVEKPSASSYLKEWDINGERALIGIERIKS
jgi:isoleucyl-tRNA synthetase